jgi:hypothetical protein
VLTAVLFGACARADEAAFTERVAAAMREASPDATVTVTAPRTLEIRFADGTSSTQSLDNLWLQCTNHPETCDSSTERVVRVVAGRQATSSSAVSRERVVATVKDRAWLDGVENSGVKPIARPFAGDLSKVYMLDLPDAMRLVVMGDLKTLKVTEDELDALAMDNLARQLTAFPHEPAGEGSPVRVLHVGDSYESARLLLHGRWRDLKSEVKGELLASAPSRDYVYFVGSGESPETLRDFRQRMQGISESESHPISPQILRWTPDGWVVEGEKE